MFRPDSDFVLSVHYALLKSLPKTNRANICKGLQARFHYVFP